MCSDDRTCWPMLYAELFWGVCWLSLTVIGCIIVECGKNVSYCKNVRICVWLRRGKTILYKVIKRFKRNQKISWGSLWLSNQFFHFGIDVQGIIGSVLLVYNHMITCDSSNCWNAALITFFCFIMCHSLFCFALRRTCLDCHNDISFI